MIDKIMHFIKKRFDKVYYSKYTLSRETLVREMFPNIKAVGDYSHMNRFINETNVDQLNSLVDAIYSFYWGEVNNLINMGQEDEITNLKGVVSLANSIKDYKEVYLLENENK